MFVNERKKDILKYYKNGQTNNIGTSKEEPKTLQEGTLTIENQK